MPYEKVSLCMQESCAPGLASLCHRGQQWIRHGAFYFEHC